MWRMRLGLVGFFVLAGWGAWMLYNTIAPTLTVADPLGHDALLAASASSGASFFVADLGIAVRVASLNSAPALQPTQIALAPLSAPPPTKPSPTFTTTPTSTSRSSTATPGPTKTPAPSRTAPPPNSAPSANAAPPTSAPIAVVAVGYQIASCGDIAARGTYRLTASVSSAGDCLTIHASDVILDCAGNTTTGQAYTHYGIAVRRFGVLGVYAPNNVEIRNCHVSQYKTGIWVEAATNIFIHNNDSSGNNAEVDSTGFGDFLGMAQSAGIQLNSTSGGRVESNTTHSNAIGIDIRGSTNIQVRGNTASNNSAWGINIMQTSGATVAGNTTADNIRSCYWGAGTKGPGCDSAGIVVQNGASGNTITGNRVLGSNGNGIFLKAHALPCGNNNVISGNTIDGAMYNGIELGFCKGNQIIGNEIVNSLDGVFLSFATQTTIRDNTIHQMRNHGIVSYNSRNSDISNNMMTRDREAIYMYYETPNTNLYFWFDSADYRSEHNCICGNQIIDNVTAGIHLNNTIYTQINGNTLRFNGLNMWFEGASDGNSTEGNIQQALARYDPLAFLFAR